MEKIIQQKIDSGNGIIILPPGEYQGPFFINHPCTVEGNGTTLWNRGETVLVVASAGVTLKNLRVELIDRAADAYSVCSSEKVSVENVEIIGNTSGFGNEDTVPDVNRQLKLGRFSADKKNTFIFEVYSPGVSTLETDIRDINLEPSDLMPGINRIRLTVSSIPSGTFLFGDIIMRSEFNRRFYIQGAAYNSENTANDMLIGTVDSEEIENLKKRVSVMESERKELIQSVRVKVSDKEHTVSEHQQQNIPGPGGVYILSRGERISIDKYSGDKITIHMGYKSVAHDIDIDPYAFMLGADGITSCDDDFVFFGNRDTVSGALVFNEDKSIEADLKKVPDHIKKISFVYSIYKPGPLDSFSKVNGPFISVLQNDREIIRYTATELFAETTIIFMEIYKHGSGWKINAIGQGYKEGLKRLCAGYGLIVS